MDGLAKAAARGVSLLRVEGLRVTYPLQDGSEFNALDGVDMTVGRGSVLGLIGESGAGKSSLALSILKLLPVPAARVRCKTLEFDGRDLLGADERQMRKIRGKEISVIFQDAASSFDPVMRVAHQVAETIVAHEKVGKAEALSKAEDMLEAVGIARNRAYDYPHRFSGGMLQRAMIAAAFICRPSLLIADEPVASLDASRRRDVLDLIFRLRAETGASALLISHDINAIASVCDCLAVMRAGEVVETGGSSEVLRFHMHPYTAKLLGSKDGRAPANGFGPRVGKKSAGCRYASHCPKADGACLSRHPELKRIAHGHFVRCVHA